MVKKYVSSLKEVRTLEKKGYKLRSMSYFVTGDGPALYILEK